MPDALQAPEAGPDRMWSRTEVPSRGQYQTIATLALRLLEVDPPATRADASIAITRLELALHGPDGPPPAPHTIPAVETF